jgi:glycine/D-amino acid oxidase-like deaminating enzyme/nitrite reductase/ring-hydroxylating ferredoxin subunit
MRSSERSRSVWKATLEPIETEPLADPAEVDVCVVGAGIAGMSVAYELAACGRRVLVLDDNAVGGGETGQTTAHLASAMDEGFDWLEKIHGLAATTLVHQSHAAAIDRIEALALAEGIDCGFERVDGYLVHAGAGAPTRLDKVLDAARRAGVDVERLDRAPVMEGGPCLRFPRQGQFHPLRYLAGLLEAIRGRGGRVHTGTRALRISGGSPATVETAAGRVTAGAVVVATNTPVNDRLRIHSKQAPYRTFAIALRVPPLAHALWWDTHEPYHYVRLAADDEGPLLIVGGEDHKTGHHDDADRRYRRLEEWARAHFPQAGAVALRWSGQVLEPFDGIGFIGRNPLDSSNVYIVTGDSGQGMTHGALGGMLIRDLILGVENGWADVYEPSRKSPRAAAEYARIQLSVAQQYLDWVRGDELASIADLRPGSGAVFRRGAQKIAVHRGHDGQLTACQATCPHLGGVVRWNSEEQSWDCPAHGSRFSPTGEVLNGPSPQPLARLELADEEPARPSAGPEPSEEARSAPPT